MSVEDSEKRAGLATITPERSPIFPLVYEELRTIAGRLMGPQGAAHTLQTTALVHEAWMKVGARDEVEFEGREHFLRTAARAMRQVLVDHARAKSAEKRRVPRATRIPIEGALVCVQDELGDLLDVEQALIELTEIDTELADVVELRFFGGLTNEETGRCLGMSRQKIERRWRTARLWLLDRLDSHDDGS